MESTTEAGAAPSAPPIASIAAAPEAGLACEERCRQLEAELEYMSGVMEVMRNDLQIKDEQFNFLYSSLRARTQQNAASRELDNALLKSRVDFLESAICGRDRESGWLQARLRAAELRLSQLDGTQGPPRPKYSLSRIPDDVIGRILEYAGTRELGMVSCADKHLLEIASLDRLWRPHYRHYWGEKRFHSVVERLHTMSSTAVESDTIPKKSWKILFGEKQLLENNWKMQRCNVTNLMAHSGTVTCIELRGNRMFSGSDDGSLVCWAINDSPSSAEMPEKLAPPPALPLAQLVDALSSSSAPREQSFHHNLYKRKEYKKRLCSKQRSFHGHGGPVWCLDYDETSDILYSGSYDQTIKVWDVKTQACRQTLRGHTGWVSSLALLRNTHQDTGGISLLASASWDATIRLWRASESFGDDAFNGLDGLDQGLQVMNAGQGNALYCISVGPGGGTVYVGCRQNHIQHWDIERNMCLGTFLGHAKEVHALDTAGSIVASGSGDGTAKLWDGNTNECSMTLRGHTDSVMAVQYDGEYKVVTGSYDKSVKMWDIRNPSEALVTIASHQGAVFCLRFDDSRLVSGGADHFLKVFDFRHDITKRVTTRDVGTASLQFPTGA